MPLPCHYHADTLIRTLSPLSRHHHTLRSIIISIFICHLTTLGFTYLTYNMELTTPTS